ncbi:5-formyltetrahydrofolate cyclo-ligase [Belliella marina]|uniref:5-formyltetrahydrofolate cyclo-ligase n=1 Tax=Belliella marina TaxID=1644146 RepID=A0ABW4VQM0_9BACT
MTKEEIRALYKSKRKQLTQEEIEILSLGIRDGFLDILKERKDIRHIHLFLPIKKLNEINTFPILEELLPKGYFLYTSILNNGSGTMETVQLNGSMEFEFDAFGIPVPKKIIPISTEKIQVVLMPLLAYDKKGNRLGYGKGYYDRFLIGLDSTVLKIGLSFFGPLEEIPSEWHDIPLDICVTPSEVFLF